MKRISTILLLFLVAITVLSQSRDAQVVLVGTLRDSLTSDAEPFATVRVTRRGETKALKVGTTDGNGRFSITLPKAGSYDVEWIVVGKTPVHRSLDLAAGKTDLGTLLTTELNTELGTATVTAQRTLVKAEIDKLSYAVTDDPDAQTSTLLEMLRKVPMVTVDGEDNIKVNGNSGFRVYVNGKPNKMMSDNPSLIFKTYPASAVKKIEVITNPGAKYDAEGVAGVLNIVTQAETSTSGYTFTPSLNLSNRRQSGMVFGMVQAGKFTLSGYGGYVHNNSSDKNTSHYEREVFDDPDRHLFAYDMRNKNRGNGVHGNFDASYELTERDLFSASAGIFHFAARSNVSSNSAMYSDAGVEQYGYLQNSYNRNNYTDVSASLDYQHTFAEDRHLTLSYRYNTSPGDNESEQTYTDLRNLPADYDLRDRISRPDNSSYEHTAQADFTTTIGEAHTLSAGMKYIYRINSSDNVELSRPALTGGDFTVDTERSLRYRHRGDVAAAYAEYMLKLGKFSMQSGLRGEYFHADVTYPDASRPNFSSHITDLVPTLSFSYSLGGAKMLRAGYNMRIGRPNIHYLSPYVTRDNPETMSYGNPALDSEHAHNFNISYSTFSQRFTLNTSLSYALSTDGLTEYTFLSDGILHSTFANSLHSKETMLSVYMNWTLFEGTQFNVNAMGGYTDYKSYGTDSHNSGFHASLWGGITQQLPFKVKAQLWGGYNTKQPQLQGSSSKFYMYSLSLSRSFLKEDRLTFALRGSNIFHRYRHFRNTVTTPQFRTFDLTRVDFLNFGVSISYRLGSLKTQVKKAARSIRNEDVVGSSGGNTGGQEGM